MQGFGPGLGLGLGLGLSDAAMPGRAFDFSGGTMPAGATFARASAGVRVDAAGLYASEAADVARWDHDPAGLALRGLLIEPAATNALAASRDLTHAAWLPSAATTTATTIVETTANASHSVAQAPGFTAGTSYCFSVVAKDGAGAKRYLVLFHQANAFGTTLTAKFDLATGAVVFVSPAASASAVPAPGGRWLCAMTATATTIVAAGATRAQIRMSDSTGSGSGYAGDGVSAIEVSDCQIEAGTVPTSRIVTTGAAASRAADVLTLNWAQRGVADGTVVLRHVFDDGTAQDIETAISGGTASVPVTLARPRLRRIVAI